MNHCQNIDPPYRKIVSYPHVLYYSMGGSSSIVMMNIRHLSKIITEMVWGKIVMTFINQRQKIKMIYIIKFKNLKIRK